MAKMFKFLIINLIVSLNLANSEEYKPLFLPHFLPVGEYRTKYLGLTRCSSIQSLDKIIFNLYLSKTSINTTEVKGNITNCIAIDDSLNLEVNMAGKDSIGGWKDNAMVFQKLKACSSLKQLLGAVWTQIMDSVGIYNATCPIPMGFYKLSGLDTAVFASANFSKKYFYGSYKFRFSFTKNNEVYGCFVIVVELRRPWETD